jgi:hypothetical protein
MRYSLKWGLLGMAYVALAAAAFGQGHWAYADLLWLATFGAICLAMLIAIFGTGARRAGGVGFALFALALAMSMQFAPDSIPTRRIFLAAELRSYSSVQAFAPYAQLGVAAPATLSNPVVSGYAAPYSPTKTTPIFPPPVPVAFPSGIVEPPINTKMRAANSLGVMVAGIVGCWLGIAAFRRQRREAEVRESAASEPKTELIKNRRLDNRPVAT